MSEVTSPILTDATGQEIVSKLNTLLTKMDNLAAAFQPNASGIVYSNTTSGLTGDDVQEAVDEVAGDVTEIKQSLSDLATVDIGDSPSILNVNDTFQIPANVWKHNIIIVSARRQGLGNSTVFRKSDLASFDAGFNLMASNTESYRLKCSNTGVLTLISKTSGLNEPFITTTGIF